MYHRSMVNNTLEIITLLLDKVLVNKDHGVSYLGVAFR